MANYKAVNVDQLEADLAIVADSIRAKAGTTGKLAFPDGFKSAVDGIQAGGDEPILPPGAYIYYKGIARSTLGERGVFEVSCSGYSNSPLYTYNCSEVNGDTSLTSSVDCGVGDLVIAAIITRDTLTVSNGWTLISTSGVNSTDTTGNGQRLSFAYKYATSNAESITVTQASAQRLYITMVALPGATGYVDNGYTYENTATSSITVKKPDGLVLWACSAPLWSINSPYALWEVSNKSEVLQLGTSAPSRLGVVMDESNDESVTFKTGTATTTLIIGSLTITGMNGFYK